MENDLPISTSLYPRAGAFERRLPLERQSDLPIGASLPRAGVIESHLSLVGGLKEDADWHR